MIADIPAITKREKFRGLFKPHFRKVNGRWERLQLYTIYVDHRCRTPQELEVSWKEYNRVNINNPLFGSAKYRDPTVDLWKT